MQPADHAERIPRLRAELNDDDTLMWRDLPDQAALHGVLAQIEALGLELYDVRRVSDDPRQ